MSYENDTADDHLDLYERMRSFLTAASGVGANWDELRNDAGNHRALFQAPGLSGDQEIFVGMSAHADPDTDTYALGFWMFKSYVEALPDLSQPGTSPVCYHSIWNDAIPYWAIANGQRLMLVSKVSTVYAAAHAGKILPGGTPGEYPQPYYVSGNVATPTSRWSSASPNNRSFFDPGEASYILRPDGAWYPVTNFKDLSGESVQVDSNYVWPYAASTNNGQAVSQRYRELTENLDGTYSLRPLILHGPHPTNETMGEIDGAYSVCGRSNAAENTVTIDGQAYLVVQNVFRTNRWDYCAIKLR